jgi:hypothetical protein
MNSKKTSVALLMEMISKIKDYLFEEKKIIISDLARFENYLSNPHYNKISGSLSLVFSAEKQLINGGKVQLSETIYFNDNRLQIWSIWNEENYSERFDRLDYRIMENNSKGFISNQVKYCLNAIYNILVVDKGTFEIATHHFDENLASKSGKICGM